MPASRQEALLSAKIARARDEHFRLVWVAGGLSMARTSLLQETAWQENGRYVDVGRALSSALLDLSPALRPASVEECFSACLAPASSGPTCLDHLDILFEPSLKVNPITLVQHASRHTLLVASWPGSVSDDVLCFGPADHPAHLEISQRDLESILHLI